MFSSLKYTENQLATRFLQFSTLKVSEFVKVFIKASNTKRTSNQKGQNTL